MGRTSIYPPSAGIYKLTCIESGKLYIGKTINLRQRLGQHKVGRKNRNDHFHNALRKYGWDSFSVEILEIMEPFDKSKDNQVLLDREAYYIELFDATNREIGYNICKFSADSTGRPLSEETKEKLRQYNLKNPSRSMLGKHHSEETKEKLRQANLGRKQSPESIEKTRQAKIGKPNPAYQNKDNIGKMGMSGKKHSEETKEKLRQANLGKKLSPECIEKMRQARLGKYRGGDTGYKPKKFKKKEENYIHPNKGQKRSEETKEKMRLAKLGKPRSVETKDKIKQTKMKNQELKKLTIEEPKNCL